MAFMVDFVVPFWKRIHNVESNGSRPDGQKEQSVMPMNLNFVNA
jgi:hypothetical protein